MQKFMSDGNSNSNELCTFIIDIEMNDLFLENATFRISGWGRVQSIFIIKNSVI